MPEPQTAQPLLRDAFELAIAAAVVREAMIADAADMVLDVAEELCPVDTGYMKSQLWVAHDSQSITVGDMAYYAPFVENGHRTVNGGWVEPQPFLRPALEVIPPELGVAGIVQLWPSKW